MRKHSLRLFACCLALTLAIPSYGAHAATFSDINGHWAQQQIEHMSTKNVISGYEDGSFKPNSPISRAEASVVIQNLFSFSGTSDEKFVDVADDSWYANAVYTLRENHIIAGVGANRFAPQANITRQDTALILARLYHADISKDYSDVLSKFSDQDDLSDYAKNAVGCLVDLGYLNGRGDNRIHPNDNITRAEFLHLLYTFEITSTPHTPDIEESDMPVPTFPNTTQRSSGSGNVGNSGGSGGGGNNNSGNNNNGDIYINTLHSGIVNADGLYYAVIVFDDAPANIADYTFKVSGNTTFAPTPVNSGGSIYKIQLPDGNSRTLTITKSGENKEQILMLDTIGNSTKTDTEIVETISADNREPYIVLTEETISLEQYLMFIKVGGNMFIKSDNTLVNTSLVKTMAFDAASSATVALPPDFDNITMDAIIAVDYDMIANNIIADELGIPASRTSDLLDKWDILDKGIVLNTDFTLYGDSLGDVVDKDIASATLPKYIKYLTSSGSYGTKVYFDTQLPDSETPPDITISDIEKDNHILVNLSEENETWYLYLTEISIPYTLARTYHYNDDKSLSADGLEMTLQKQEFGPTSYVDEYTTTFKSFGFDDVTATFKVVNTPPAMTPTWDDAEGHLALRAAFSYYAGNLESLIVNGVTLSAGDVTTSINHINIPYKYLVNGENIITLTCTNYSDQTIRVMSDPSFVVPKAAPKVSLLSAFHGTRVITLSYADVIADSDEEAWVNALAQNLVSVSDRFGNVTISDFTDNGDQTLTITVGSNLSRFYDYNVVFRVPDYEKVTVTFTPVQKAPTLSSEWTGDFHYKITDTTNNFSYSNYASIFVDGIELVKGSDYISSSYGIEIYPQAFEESTTHTVTVVVADYEDNELTVATPDGFVKPVDAPALTTAITATSSVVYVDFDNVTDWANNITSVKVGTSNITGWSIQDNRLALPSGSYFSYSGTYTISFVSTGYSNTSTTVQLVKDVDLRVVHNVDDGRFEITAYSAGSNSRDSYFFHGLIAAELNDTVFETYTFDSTYYPYTMYVTDSHFDEGDNTLTLTSTDYMPQTLTINKGPAPAAAPTLTFVGAATSSKTIVVQVNDADWLNQVTKDSIILTYGSFGSSETVDNIEIDSQSGTITITTGYLYTFYDYTLKIRVDGYYSATTASFRPTSTYSLAVPAMAFFDDTENHLSTPLSFDVLTTTDTDIDMDTTIEPEFDGTIE